MTAIVGILCREGVVIGTDSSSTLATAEGPYGVRTIESSAKKISIVDGRIIITGTGEVGLNQRFCGIVQTLSGIFSAPNATDLVIGVQLSQAALQNFGSTGVGKGQINYGCL